MIEIKGQFNRARVFAGTVEESAMLQLKNLCSLSSLKDAKIRVMPDVHAGKGCTVGTTMSVGKSVIPNLVGVDIGCGMEVVRLYETAADFDKLDRLIRENVPAGTAVRGKPHPASKPELCFELKCADKIDLRRALVSVGTLGGGNHFIELDRGEDGALLLVIHSGSRNLGVQVAEYYQKYAAESERKLDRVQTEELIKKLKGTPEAANLSGLLEKRKLERSGFDPDLAALKGEAFDDYIHDMKLVQQFADLNRKAIAAEIIGGMGFTETSRFTTVHNYIDLENMILRKGAVSAQEGEILIIPMNMRDGSFICRGKGNPDWNFSAPHGAGRIMSRAEARRAVPVSEFIASMKGVYTTSVGKSTVDESPYAYKPAEAITAEISPTAEIIETVKPVYNFKAG